MRAKLIWSKAILSMVLLTGCPEKTEIWIAEGSTADELAFRIGKSRGDTGGHTIDIVRVDACAPAPDDVETFWIASIDSLPMPPQWLFTKIIRYGTPPPGWVTEEGPLPITPGCYRAYISGTGRTQFRVNPDGSVVEEKFDGPTAAFYLEPAP